ncbi:MAG: molybdopterin-dependent oxidoreductase [Treponema sp.]|nr:molybdopterin-dependent oxidoreductase [Treponema sp.]
MESLPFLEDIYPQDLLYAKTIRSPVARGIIKFIKTPKLPDNYTFFTARNIPGVNLLEGTLIPILAEKELSYIGEPVAILLGPNKVKLEELAAKCIVYADEEKAVFDIKDENSKIEAKREIKIGNAQEIFEKNEKIITGSYTTGIQEHWYAEPAGAVCFLREQKDSEDKVEAKNKKTAKESFKNNFVLRTASQWPYHVKRSVSRVLDIEQTNVIIEPTSLNLHMDGKLWYPSLIACHAALGSFITKKAVRLILTKEEDFLFTPKRFYSNIDITTAIKENGDISAAEIDISVNLGAYGVNANEILDHVCLGVLAFYRIPDIKLTAKAYCTNIPPQGPFSGFGLAQGLFAKERHVSQIADTLKLDPAQWRLNCIEPNFVLPVNQQKNSLSGEELIKTAANLSDYYRKWSSHELLLHSRKEKLPDKNDNPRGIGLAVAYQNNGLLYHGRDNGVYSVEVTLTKECILEIRASITTPEDYNKIWEKVALETMSIKPEMVRIISTGAPDCGPSCSSRNITVITKLVERCCLAIRKQRFHDPLPITVRRSVKPQNGALLSGHFTAPPGKVMDINSFSKLGMAAAVVEVSIDIVECVPKIRGVWLAVDGGKIISKNRAKRSIMRGTAQALGWAFTENIEYIDGILPRKQYDNYNIFSPMEIPPIHIHFIENDFSEPKGIGDLPSSCIPAAFLQAVSQATGNCFKSIPIKRKDIWEIVR